MKAYNGRIKYNEDLKCYGLAGEDGAWLKPKLEDGDRILIEINGEVFRTDFKKYGNASPVLEPLPWSNWDYLCTRPVQYQDFENRPAPPNVKEERRERIKAAAMLAIVSIAVAAFTALLLAWIPTESMSFYQRFIWLFQFWYLILGVPATIGALLTICSKKMKPGQSVKFGCGFWYGGMGLSLILQELHKMIASENDLRFLAYIIAAGICCAVWFKISEKEK